MQRSSSFKISPALPQCVRGGCLWWDTPLMLSESKGYRITNLHFSKIVVSVCLNGVTLTPRLPDKLISVTGCQEVHTQDRAPGRARWHPILFETHADDFLLLPPLNWAWDAVIDSGEPHAVPQSSCSAEQKPMGSLSPWAHQCMYCTWSMLDTWKLSFHLSTVQSLLPG